MIPDAALLVNLAVLAAVLGGGFAVSRHAGIEARRRALPAWQRSLVAGASFGPLWYHLLTDRFVDVWLVDETVAAVAAFVVSWLGLTLLLARVGGGEAPAATGC